MDPHGGLEANFLAFFHQQISWEPIDLLCICRSEKNTLDSKYCGFVMAFSYLLSTLALWHFFVKVFVASQFERLPSLRVSVRRFSPFSSQSLHSDFWYLQSEVRTKCSYNTNISLVSYRIICSFLIFRQCLSQSETPSGQLKIFSEISLKEIWSFPQSAQISRLK